MADNKHPLPSAPSPLQQQPLPSNRVDVDGIEGNATVQQNRSSTNPNLRNGVPNVRVIVRFLDSSNSIFPVSRKALGQTLFYSVCESLNLIEVDYFGLQYLDSKGNPYWLDLEKPLCKQLELTGKNITMFFAVKFYTIEPSNLEDELTRYLFALQIKKDLAEGSLLCNENISAMLCAYTVQAECGDYNMEEYSNHLYISKTKLIPQQDEEFELKVMENHKKLIGLSPADADMQLLLLAKDQDMYGIKLSPVKDHEGVPLNLAVIHHGILIFQNQTKVNTFDWIKIRKLSFKRKHFFIKLHQEEFFGDVLEFVFQHRNECKNFWKKCIEQHSFFKCFEIKRRSRQKLRIFSRGSSFRYAGRTQQQLSDFIKTNNTRKQKTFQRSSSMKLNSTKDDDDCLGYGSDGNDSKHENPDSISYATSCNTIAAQQLHKSCDTIDQESGLNYYSLHSILSYADHSSSLINGKSNEYSLHATSKYMASKISQSFKYNTSSQGNTNNPLYGCTRIKDRLKFILVKNLPAVASHSAVDDSITDVFLDYLHDYAKLKSYIDSVCTKAMVRMADVHTSHILLANIDDFFRRDFKNSNFDMQYNAFCMRAAIPKAPTFNLGQEILSQNLNEFKLLF